MSNESEFTIYTPDTLDKVAQRTWEGLSLKLSIEQLDKYGRDISDDRFRTEEPVLLTDDNALIYVLASGAGYAQFRPFEQGVDVRIGVQNPELLGLVRESLQGAGYVRSKVRTPSMENETREPGDQTGVEHPFASVLGYN